MTHRTRPDPGIQPGSPETSNAPPTGVEQQDRRKRGGDRGRRRRRHIRILKTEIEANTTAIEADRGRRRAGQEAWQDHARDLNGTRELYQTRRDLRMGVLALRPDLDHDFRAYYPGRSR